MARVSGTRTADAIQEAAANLFFQRGYAATSLREIASEVGIQVGSLYNHIDGKNELLRNIMERIMSDLLLALAEALDGARDPVDRLRRALDCHIRFHAMHSRDVFIGNTELRSLPDADREIVIARRDEYEALLRGLIRDVCDKGFGDAIDVRLQSYAIVAIGTHVASWYHADGSLSLNEVVSAYTETILRQLNVRKPEAAATA
jgi:TetR/AcrR family transcriptional regulator, cholesterol catabolism regulator